jgi:hypothetical protein
MIKPLLLAAVLLSALSLAQVVEILEVPDEDAQQVALAYVVDGDTVRLATGEYVRLVGYDAYELNEPRGDFAKIALESLCRGSAYLDVDDFEPRDGYGRILGYLWCRMGGGDRTWFVSVQRYFIVVGRLFVKRLLYIPPDEHPYTVWLSRHVVVFDRPVEVYVYNSTSRIYLGMTDRVVLLGGVYDVYVEGRYLTRLRLLTDKPETVMLNITAPAANATPPAANITSTVPRTVTVTKTVTKTETVISTVTNTVIRTEYLTQTRVVATPQIYTVTQVIKERGEPGTAVLLALPALIIAIIALTRRRCKS